MTTYVFDGSLEGLLCAVFEWFERKPGQIILKTEKEHQPDAFTHPFHVTNDRIKADRVWKALQKRLPYNWMRKFYCCYLSEVPAAWGNMFEFCCYLFSHPSGAEHNYGNPHVLAVAEFAKKVEREKHRMEAFIRFQKTTNDLFYCGIDPDFNVLPLIIKHFKDRYINQQWIIYDLKRNYGIYYDLEKTEEIRLESKDMQSLKKVLPTILSEEEDLYSTLWKDYFKSTNIKARKNTKLHLQYVPKRYWKYLTEKQ